VNTGHGRCSRPVCVRSVVTGVAVADDGVDELVDVHQCDGDVVRLSGDRVNHLLTDGAEQHVARHVARRREHPRVTHRVHCTTTVAPARPDLV